MPETPVVLIGAIVFQVLTLGLGTFFLVNSKIREKHPYGLFAMELMLAAVATPVDFTVFMFTKESYFDFLFM